MLGIGVILTSIDHARKRDKPMLTDAYAQDRCVLEISPAPGLRRCERRRPSLTGAAQSDELRSSRNAVVNLDRRCSRTGSFWREVDYD